MATTLMVNDEYFGERCVGTREAFRSSLMENFREWYADYDGEMTFDEYVENALDEHLSRASDDILNLPLIGSPTAEQVRSSRQSAGLTQEQAAHVISSSRRAWQEWEAGRRNMPGAKWELFQRKVHAGEVGAEYKVHLNSERGAVQATEIRYSDTERGIKQIAGRAMKTWAMEAIFFRRLGFDEFGRPGYDRITF